MGGFYLNMGRSTSEKVGKLTERFVESMLGGWFVGVNTDGIGGSFPEQLFVFLESMFVVDFV